MLRSVLAVGAGCSAAGAAVLLSDLIFTFLYRSGQESGSSPVRKLAVAALVLVILYGAAGAWVCVRIARRRPWAHVLALLAAGDGLLLVSMLVFWGRQPIWYGIGLLALFPPAVLLGGRAAIARAAHNEAHVPAGCRE